MQDTKKLEQEILHNLARLGGQTMHDDGIRHEGTSIILPETMSDRDAVKALLRHIEANEEEVAFSVTILCRPWDGAFAFEKCVREQFGMLTQVGTPGMFGTRPPERRTININVEEQVQVPWGRVELPAFPGCHIDLGGAFNREHGVVFQLSFHGPKKFQAHVAGLFKLIEAEVKKSSIYRGKAFDGGEEPNFLDLRGVDPKHVIYSDDVMTQLEANVWSLIRYSNEHRNSGLPLKRAVLFEGPYGTGKTLGAYLTAKEAVENGWTFIYCRPQKDDLEQVMQTARLYQPSVVFFEDMDEIVDPNHSQDNVSRLLDVFDGMASKGTELMVILTTNHKERIHKGMLRPGRLDAVISIGALDVNGVARMIRSQVPEAMLGNVDVTEVHQHMEGFMPAFVKEAIDRAKRYSLARNKGTIKKLSTADFVEAADGLRPQLDLMEHNEAHTKQDKIANLLRAVVTEGSTSAVRDNIVDGFLVEVQS